MWIFENFYRQFSKSQIIGAKTKNCVNVKNIEKVLVNNLEWALKKMEKSDNQLLPLKKMGKEHIKSCHGNFLLSWGKKTADCYDST